MKIIKYTDNDQLNKPRTGSASVYSLEKTDMTKATQGPITREALIKITRKFSVKELEN